MLIMFIKEFVVQKFTTILDLAWSLLLSLSTGTMTVFVHGVTPGALDGCQVRCTYCDLHRFVQDKIDPLLQLCLRIDLSEALSLIAFICFLIWRYTKFCSKIKSNCIAFQAFLC